MKQSIKKVKTHAVMTLATGQKVLLSLEDVGTVERYKWFYGKVGTTEYVMANGSRVNGHPAVTLYLHRLINQPAAGMTVHHRNHDTKDNRRENLVNITRRDNTCVGNGTNRAEGYLGVFERVPTKSNKRPYMARVSYQKNGKALNKMVTCIDQVSAAFIRDILYVSLSNNKPIYAEALNFPQLIDQYNTLNGTTSVLIQ